jgi:hypothetical protein
MARITTGTPASAASPNTGPCATQATVVRPSILGGKQLHDYVIISMIQRRTAFYFMG